MVGESYVIEASLAGTCLVMDGIVFVGQSWKQSLQHCVCYDA